MGRGPLPREVLVSKKLSRLLRHDLEKEGLQMNAAGYVNLQDVLSNRNIRSLNVSFDEIKDIVVSNDKQRFSLIPAPAVQSATPVTVSGHVGISSSSGGTATPSAETKTTAISESKNPKDYLIRANQGHSIAVDSETLLSPINESNLPATCVHGTTHGAWPLVVKSGGLKRMARQHVHFASGLPANMKTGISLVGRDDGSDIQTETSDKAQEVAAVISGMRNSSTVLVYLDIKKALDGGLKFWQSDNGVILTEGDENGLVPLIYFKSVEDRSGLGTLVEDGTVMKEAPPEWDAKSSGKRGGRGQGGKRDG